MESWQKIWREGLAPQLNQQHLEALRKGLVEDDKALIQGGTTVPPPLEVVKDWPCEGADAIGYCHLKGGGVIAPSVQDVEEFFAKTCFEIDKLIGEPAGCRWFLNWYDDTPRAEMIAKLLPEVEASLARLNVEVLPTCTPSLAEAVIRQPQPF